ncbi:MAG: phosphoribosyltransferase [Chloroflexi bacterium]|nr:phosphoribosyltransferase [Chloroflexota bacterium]
MDKKKRPATQSSSAAQVDDDWVARLADFLFGEDKKTGPPTQSPSADAGDDEAARLADFLVTDELGVTRPVSEVPSSYAARMFGEEAARIYGVMGRLLHLNRLPVGDLSLITVGFRITDRPNEKWTRRFNQFKYGEPAAIRAATRTFCAAFDLFSFDWDPRVVVVSSVSSGQNIVQHDTPASILASALAESRGWEWLPHHVTKDRHPRITGIPSAAKRDATVDGVYLSTPIGGEPGLVIVVDDFCTRGATLADIARAVRESNPGWKIQGASLAKAERAAYWKGELTNAHIHDSLDATWRGDPEAASPWY